MGKKERGKGRDGRDGVIKEGMSEEKGGEMRGKSG